MGTIRLPATPYRWPYDGGVAPACLALVVIDMQVDFCGPGGYVDAMGYDIALTRAPIGPIAECLAWARRVPGLTVIHTREGHRHGGLYGGLERPGEGCGGGEHAG